MASLNSVFPVESNLTAEEQVPTSAAVAMRSPQPRARRTSFPTSVRPGQTPPERHKQCDVCGDESDRRHLNYGANACFSCRAFFRRVHQHAANPVLVCKWNGTCDVTVKNRRRCQKCRYDRCLSAGMRPECVLDLGQRRYRFRKALEKRAAAQSGLGEQQTQSDPPSHTNAADDSRACHSDDDERGFSVLPLRKRIKMRYLHEEEKSQNAVALKEVTPSKKVLVDQATSTEENFWFRARPTVENHQNWFREFQRQKPEPNEVESELKPRSTPNFVPATQGFVENHFIRSSHQPP